MWDLVHKCQAFLGKSRFCFCIDILHYEKIGHISSDFVFVSEFGHSILAFVPDHYPLFPGHQSQNAVPKTKLKQKNFLSNRINSFWFLSINILHPPDGCMNNLSETKCICICHHTLLHYTPTTILFRCVWQKTNSKLGSKMSEGTGYKCRSVISLTTCVLISHRCLCQLQTPTDLGYWLRLSLKQGRSLGPQLRNYILGQCPWCQTKRNSQNMQLVLFLILWKTPLTLNNLHHNMLSTYIYE